MIDTYNSGSRGVRVNILLTTVSREEERDRERERGRGEVGHTLCLGCLSEIMYEVVCRSENALSLSLAEGRKSAIWPHR